MFASLWLLPPLLSVVALPPSCLESCIVDRLLSTHTSPGSVLLSAAHEQCLPALCKQASLHFHSYCRDERGRVLLCAFHTHTYTASTHTHSTFIHTHTQLLLVRRVHFACAQSSDSSFMAKFVYICRRKAKPSLSKFQQQHLYSCITHAHLLLVATHTYSRPKCCAPPCGDGACTSTSTRPASAAAAPLLPPNRPEPMSPASRSSASTSAPRAELPALRAEPGRARGCCMSLALRRPCPLAPPLWLGGV